MTKFRELMEKVFFEKDEKKKEKPTKKWRNRIPSDDKVLSFVKASMKRNKKIYDELGNK